MQEELNTVLAEVVERLNNRDYAGVKSKGCYLLRGIPEDLRIAARHRAFDEGITFRDMIIKSLRQYLDNNSKKGGNEDGRNDND